MQFKFFPAFFASPRKIKFDQQEETEVIELFLRQHPIVNVWWVTGALIFLIFPPIFFQIDVAFNLNLTSQVPVSIIINTLIVYYLILIAYVFEQFLGWYFNVYIVTNLHIVDVNFYSLLSKEVVEISLDDIEVIAHTTAGVFGSLFHYGTVEIETAAETKRIHFDKVPRPDIVTDKVQDLQRARKAFHGGGKHAD